MHLKAHKVMQQGCIFLPLLSCNFNDQLSSKFRFVILCMCCDHQVRRLVFDNYQRCPGPLRRGQGDVSKWSEKATNPSWVTLRFSSSLNGSNLNEPFISQVGINCKCLSKMEFLIGLWFWDWCERVWVGTSAVAKLGKTLMQNMQCLTSVESAFTLKI